MRIKCNHCGYVWDTRSALKYVSCGSCLGKVPNPSYQGPGSLPAEVAVEKPLVEEEKVAKIMSDYLGVTLAFNDKVEIDGKTKTFDFISAEHKVVGELRRLEYGDTAPTSQMADSLSADIWLMQRLGKKWRKIIVGQGYRKYFEEYAKDYGPWIGDVEMYYIDDKDKVHKIQGK